jgi:hypothetical protein
MSLTISEPPYCTCAIQAPQTVTKVMPGKRDPGSKLCSSPRRLEALRKRVASKRKMPRNIQVQVVNGWTKVNQFQVFLLGVLKMKVLQDEARGELYMTEAPDLAVHDARGEPDSLGPLRGDEKASDTDVGRPVSQGANNTTPPATLKVSCAKAVGLNIKFHTRNI